MGFLIGLFARLGLGPQIATAAARALILGLVVLAVLWLRHDAYRDGERATDSRWKAAEAKLHKQAAATAGRASEKADERAADHVEQVAKEKERIDEAIDAGTSPFDVLFRP